MKPSPSSVQGGESWNWEEDTPIKGLTARTISGAMWTSVGETAALLLHWVVFVILARLLNPEDFGIYALGAVFVGFGRIFSDAGLAPSLIQRKQLSTDHIRTAFTSSVMLGMLMALVLAAFAPFIASLMNSAKLEPVIRVLSLIFLIRGAGIVARALLKRDLRIPELARTEVLSYLIGYGFVGTTLAFAGFGYWALVWAAVIQAGLQSLQFLMLRPHTKRLGIRKRALHDLLSFGLGASAGQIGNYLAMKGDYLVVGRLLGTASLGIYSRAYELMAMPVGMYQSVTKTALFSAVSKVQDDRIRLARAHRRTAAVTALLLIPTGLGLFALAPEVIHLLLGSKWTSVVVPLQIMALGIFFRSGYGVGAAVAKGAGDIHRLALRQWIYAGLVVFGAGVGHFYGVTGVAIGVMLALITHFMIVSHLSLQSSGMSWQDFGAAHIPGLTLGSITLVTVMLPAYVMRNLDAPALVTLLVSASLFMLVTGILFQWLPARILGKDGIWALASIRALMPLKHLDGRRATPASPEPAYHNSADPI